MALFLLPPNCKLLYTQSSNLNLHWEPKDNSSLCWSTPEMPICYKGELWWLESIIIPFQKNVMLLIRGGQSGFLISAEVPAAFIEFKVSSEPCAWESYLKICTVVRRSQGEGRHGTFTLLFLYNRCLICTADDHVCNCNWFPEILIKIKKKKN